MDERGLKQGSDVTITIIDTHLKGHDIGLNWFHVGFIMINKMYFRKLRVHIRRGMKKLYFNSMSYTKGLKLHSRIIQSGNVCQLTDTLITMVMIMILIIVVIIIIIETTNNNDYRKKQ